ncbi:uncharacterized protein [Hetaerina americana]|uniref:uncharacterized protein n=1 Tax=Hetaerina americana TaxID=62018 RepID=UPI003A7F10C7
MAPQTFSCSVCDDQFATVSTLHYHQMCLHTTEELSLAILSIRELTVNASPVAGSSGNAASPSNDCEDKLLRNGLAKYPRFLTSSRKSKVLNPESKLDVKDSETDAPNDLVADKENIVQNKAVCNNSENEPSEKELVEPKVEEHTEPKEPDEPVRSSLWGAIKTLDGKTVDAPVIKIEKKRNGNRLSKFTKGDTGRKDSPEKCESYSKKAKNVSVSPDSDSPSNQEKVLEKHLKLMNMSSFDDCIELGCSDDSDEDDIFVTDVSDEEGKNCEIKEEETSVKDEELVSENCSEEKSLNSNEALDESKGVKSKRLRGKIQKHSTWYKGGTFQGPTNSKSPKKSISILKDRGKTNEENEGKRFENREIKLEEKDKSSDMSPMALDGTKLFTDTCVQTDNFFYEEVSNSVVRMLEANSRVIGNKANFSLRKGSPKKKHILSSLDKNQRDKNAKLGSVLKEELLTGAIRVKSEVVFMEGEKRFYCNECAKTYKKRSHLERHKRVHTGERPFICPYCDKGFSVRSILNQHIRIHTGEKPYACTICAARFPQKSGLMTHMMLHTGKPFKCDQCDKAFVSNHKLVHHLKNHAGDRPHVCNVCTSAFFTSAALDDHKTLHSRNRKHVCNKCNASFVHEVYLKIHLATHLLEADCENAAGEIDVGPVSPDGSTSPQTNSDQHNELTLTLDAIDQFCNGETIMMDLSV